LNGNPNTNKPLREWFRVIHLMLTSKKGMSALQIMRYQRGIFVAEFLNSARD
jgi:hypothetical protein